MTWLFIGIAVCSPIRKAYGLFQAWITSCFSEWLGKMNWKLQRLFSEKNFSVSIDRFRSMSRCTNNDNKNKKQVNKKKNEKMALIFKVP